MLWRKCSAFTAAVVVCCLLEGKLENISVIANDSILIEVGVCVCDKRAVIWHVTEIFLFTFSSLFIIFQEYTKNDLPLPSRPFIHISKNDV